MEVTIAKHQGKYGQDEDASRKLNMSQAMETSGKNMMPVRDLGLKMSPHGCSILHRCVGVVRSSAKR